MPNLFTSFSKYDQVSRYYRTIITLFHCTILTAADSDYVKFVTYNLEGSNCPRRHVIGFVGMFTIVLHKIPHA
jgi:hypothetical protein